MANMRKDKKGRGLHTGEQQRKDGIYLYRYTDITGKRRTIYAGDLPELRQKEKQIRRDLDDNIMTDVVTQNMTLNELFEQYIAAKIAAQSSKIHYRSVWNSRIKPELGDIKVTQIKPFHIKSFYVKLEEKGYKSSSIKLTHCLLSSVLDAAVDNDIIRKNPAKNAITLSVGADAKEKQVLTMEQQKNLLAFVANSKVYKIYLPMFIIFLEIGLRCGELVGLTWDDVSFENKTLSINHQLSYNRYGDGYHFLVIPPKTAAGIRDIPLTDKVLDAFRQQKETNQRLNRYTRKEINGYGNFIFLTNNNMPYASSCIDQIMYHVSDAYNRKEQKAAIKDERKPNLMPKFSPHDLRHTACTNKARLGMNVRTLQYIMGHGSSSVTLEVYNHLDNIEDARNEMQRIEETQLVSVS